MIHIIAAAAFLGLFVYGIYREPRSFWNIVYLSLGARSAFIAAVLHSQHYHHFRQAMNFSIYVVLPLGICGLCVLLLYDCVVLIRKEGKRLKNLLPGAFAVALFWGMFAVNHSLYLDIGSPLVKCVLWFSALMMLFVSHTFIGFYLCSKLYQLMPKNADCDFVIVHGSGLLRGHEVGPLLRGRVDKAIDVFEHGNITNKKLILSGGRGHDEEISEAEAMKSYVETKDFYENAIVLEDRSKNTYENLKYSAALPEVGDADSKRFIFVTSDYHVMRTAYLSKKLKIKNIVGVGSKTARYYWPSAFIREYIAVMNMHKWLVLFPILLFVINIIGARAWHLM